MVGWHVTSDEANSVKADRSFVGLRQVLGNRLVKQEQRLIGVSAPSTATAALAVP